MRTWLGAAVLLTVVAWADEPPPAPVLGTSLIEPKGAVACFHALEKTLPGASTGYPKGYVAVPASRFGENGAELFTPKGRLFFPTMMPIDGGEFMELWGRSPKEFLVPLSDGKAVAATEDRAPLAAHLLEKMRALFTRVPSRALPAVKVKSEDEPLTIAEMEELFRLKTRAEKAIADLAPAPEAPRTPVGPGPHAVLAPENAPLPPQPIDRGKLRTALAACEKVKGDTQVKAYAGLLGKLLAPAPVQAPAAKPAPKPAVSRPQPPAPAPEAPGDPAPSKGAMPAQ